MRIKYKILIYFSSTVILLTAITFVLIYIFFSKFREEEYQQRQQVKISNTLLFLTDILKTEEDLIEELDRLTINDLFDEKLLIFNGKKELIYSSLDDTPVKITKSMFDNLNASHRFIESKEGLYDVVGIYIEKNSNVYYGFSKAFDTFGYSKLDFLRYTLLVAFGAISVLVLLVSLYLSKKISDPIISLSDILNNFRVGTNHQFPVIKTTTSEIKILNERFYELAKRSNDAFEFQKNSIHHISHQLRTPIAVLLSDLERIKENVKDEPIKLDLEKQTIKTKSLADIINTLLQISKTEAGQSIATEVVRVDEVVFDIIGELNLLYPNFLFEINYIPDLPNAENLELKANEVMLKQAFLNVLNNCIAYSTLPKAEVLFDSRTPHRLKISVVNQGNPLTKEEQQYLFSHFFRGDNSHGKLGFGLGLVLSQKIIKLSGGKISYKNPQESTNVINIEFVLS